MPGCESRSLPDSRSEMRGSPAANASSAFGRRRGPASVRSHHGGRRARTGPGSPTGATKTREPSRSWRRTRNSPRHPRDRGARSDDSILDLTIAAMHVPHGIVSHRAGSPSIGRTAHNTRSACLLPGRIRLAAIAPDRRIGARSSQAPDVAGCTAIPSYSPADSESARFLCIAAYVENSPFCRRPRDHASRYAEGLVSDAADIPRRI